MTISGVVGSMVASTYGTTAAKPTGPATGPDRTAASAAAGAITDSVSLSPLAKSLRNESLMAFNALTDDQRGALSALVDSGKMSGEDIHNALKERVKQARSTAYWAGSRMFTSDNAELFAYGSEDLGGDLREGLSKTLKQRSELTAKLMQLEDDGHAGSEEHTALAKKLRAAEPNPLLMQRGMSSRVPFDPFHAFMLEDSRMMKTKTEVNAFDKLKATGFDIDALDRRLRGLGERDAAAIAAGTAKIGGFGTVAKDAEFSVEDAVMKPLTYVDPSAPDTTPPELRERFARAERLMKEGQRMASMSPEERRAEMLRSGATEVDAAELRRQGWLR